MIGKKRGRRQLYPGEKIVMLQVQVRESDLRRFHAAVPKAKRPSWLRDAFVRKLDEGDAPITQEWLEEIGFQKVHMNPTYHGGFFRYYLDVPNLRQVSIMVSFGDGYAKKGYLVWMNASIDTIGLDEIKTQSQLRQFCQLVTGKTIEECVMEQNQDGQEV